MIAPYVLRLVCLCLASFFVVNGVAGLTAFLASRAIVRMAEKMRPRFATRFLLCVRLLPFLLGIGAVLALCIPSYLWLEPNGTFERVGLVCLTLALLATASWLLSIVRSARAIAVSLRCNRTWRQESRETLLKEELPPALVVQKEAPLLALAGVLRPRLVISESVLRSLSRDQLEVALQHEKAHGVSRDNLKRLVFLLAPDPFPFFGGFSFLEQAWVKFTEWAADDEATRGDSIRAISLAAALVSVARMGIGPRLSLLHTSLMAGDQDLSARIERLLQTETVHPAPLPRSRALLATAGAGVAVCFATLILWPATLSSVHRLLEQFLR
jgi:Zn-dependent protease with chaperone function